MASIGSSASAANIGASFSSYEGNPILGGARGKPVEFSLDPLQRLGAFVNLRDRNFWEQRQKNGVLLATEIANSMDDYDLSLLDESDRNKIKDEYLKWVGDLDKMARDTKVTEDPKMMVDLQLKKNAITNDFDQRFKMAKQRNVTKKLREEEIAKAYAGQPELMKVQLDALNKEISSTDITHQISPLIPWKPKDIKVEDAISHTVNSGVFGSSKDVGIESVIFLPSDNETSADKMALGMQNFEIPKTIKDPNSGAEIPNPDYDPTRQKIQNVAGKTEGTLWAGIAGTINDVTKKYINPTTGVFDENAFLSSAPKDIVSAYKYVMSYNDYLKKQASLALKGVYDYKGIGTETPKTISASDFTSYLIDPSKGIEPSQLAMVAIFKKFNDANTKVKVDRHNTDLERANAAALLEGRRLENQAKKIGLEVLKKGGKSGSGKNADLISQPAILFADFVNRASQTGQKLSGGKGGVAISYRAVAPIYKEALGISGLVGDNAEILANLKKDGGIVVNPDGNIFIVQDMKDYNKTGKYDYLVTPEAFKQGLISAIKGGNTVDGNFQSNSEEVFNSVIGDATQYFRNVYSGKQNAGNGNKSTSTGGGMTDEEYKAFKKKNGLE